ncbi:mitofusin, partial [Mytilus galloprovincialis]
MSGNVVTDLTQSFNSNTSRSLENGHNSLPNSPLKFFARAKSRSNDIFKGILDFVSEAETFLQDIKGKENEEYKVIHPFLEMVKGIIEKLNRDHMKVVFFGRTSNGKSTVINAMLRNSILPSGIGHTTHCFLQVEGTEASEGFLLTDDSEDPKSISSIKQLASALSTMKLKENSLIRIVWPNDKCRLLKEDVVFVDSPGIDITPDLDSWIDQFCLDADVFVLVGNAESTLMQTEKNFFHKVSSRLSKPNIFILQNRWDLSVDEEDAYEVKEQHYTRNTHFLTDELKVADKQEAKNRIFFISAKEALISRLHEDSKKSIPTGSLQKKFAERLSAFENFETAFEVCISRSAVQTKFQTHSERGKKIIADLKKIMMRTHTDCSKACEDQFHKRKETIDELSYLDKQLDLLTEEMKQKIENTVEKVEKHVSFVLNEEIKQLSALVDDFCTSFHPDNLVMSVYKKELHNHIEEGLGRNVQQRCSSEVHQQVENTQKEITDRLAALLKDEERAQLNNALSPCNFEMSYKLDCRNLCSEFEEDIQFRFSLGISSLMHRFLGTKRMKHTLGGGQNYIPRPVNSSTVMSHESDLYQHINEVLMSVTTSYAIITPRSTMGGIVAGLVLKVTGWKVVVAVGSLYCVLYLYEWLSWTNKSMERRFKSQFVEYAASKLRLIVDMTSFNCSHQVQ